MPGAHTVLAVVFDFDETLMPDSTTKLLNANGIDTQEFWTVHVRKLVEEEGFEPTLAWLTLLLERVGEGKPLGQLTNSGLRDFGASLDNDFYPGVVEFFEEARAIAAKAHRDLRVEFYVISGGLAELIKGSRVIDHYFAAVYGCELGQDPRTGLVRSIKRAITFTEKTRYLFEISKGLEPTATRAKPYLVNKDVPEGTRRIPFKNMIYVGDGLTDIPCFSLLKKLNGSPFGVFDPENEASAKRALLEFLKTDRVISMHAPRYGRKDELGSLLRAAVAATAARMVSAAGEAE